MQSVGRLVAGMVALGALAVGLTGCGDDGDDTRTIAILRAVEGSPAEDLAFLPALAELGYPADELEVLGVDESHPDPDEAAEAVTDWVDQGAELIVALSTTSAQAAAEGSDGVPILFLVNDPATAGLVADERHPEGELTGVTYRVPADRALSLAEEAFGQIDLVGCLYGADPGSDAAREDLVRGADALGMGLQCASYASPEQAPAAADELLAAGVDLLVMVNSPATVRGFDALEAALADERTPILTSTPWTFATLTFQPDGEEVYRQLARQVARVLEGDAVADVPVEDPGRFRIVVNVAAAERLGLEIPQSVLDRADDVVR